MAVFVPVENVAEFVVHQRLYGQAVLNVYHVKKEGGWTSASMATMAVVFISWYNDDLAPNQSLNLQYEKVTCRDLTTASGAVASVDFPTNSGGDVNGESLPAQNAISISHTTGFAGRSFRGRTSYAGIMIDQVANNLIDTAIAGLFVDAVDALDAAITAGGGVWGIVSRYSGYTQTAPKFKKVPTPRLAGIFTDIIDNSCSRRVGSQDSRNNG